MGPSSQLLPMTVVLRLSQAPQLVTFGARTPGADLGGLHEQQGWRSIINSLISVPIKWTSQPAKALQPNCREALTDCICKWTKSILPKSGGFPKRILSDSILWGKLCQNICSNISTVWGLTDQKSLNETVRELMYGLELT